MSACRQSGTPRLEDRIPDPQGRKSPPLGRRNAKRQSDGKSGRLRLGEEQRGRSRLRRQRRLRQPPRCPLPRNFGGPHRQAVSAQPCVPIRCIGRRMPCPCGLGVAAGRAFLRRALAGGQQPHSRTGRCAEAGSRSRTYICGLVSRRPNRWTIPAPLSRESKPLRLWACSCLVASCSFDALLDSSSGRCDHHRLVPLGDRQSMDHRLEEAA
jgi:hypothetical protein